MVRLKVTRLRPHHERHTGFNSTMVRLKERQSSEGLSTVHWFQFHNGSIKRMRVKFKHAPAPEFQFHNGSIKSADVIIDTHEHAGFNSTMVRLKEGLLGNRPTAGNQFQFHNGSIKSQSQ